MFTKQNECISLFKGETIEARLYWDGATQGGKCRLDYELKQGETVLCSGQDMLISPIHYPDSIDAMVSLLSFMTVRPEDTDSAYFANYSPEMMRWIGSPECEYLGTLVRDFEEKEPSAVEYFNQNVQIYPNSQSHEKPFYISRC